MRKMNNPTAIFKKPLTLYQKIVLIILGLLMAGVILELGLHACGFIVLFCQEHRNRCSMQQGGIYRIMCVGESTTQGEYPRFLEEILNAEKVKIKFSVIDKGLSATNTNLILDRMESNIKKYKPNVVVAMMGINDVGAPHMPLDFSVTAPDFYHTLKIYKCVKLLRLRIRVKFSELFRKNDTFYVKLGMKFNSQGKIGKAKSAFNKAIKINPRNSDAYFRLAWLSGLQEQRIIIAKLVDKYKEVFAACLQEDAYIDNLFVQLNAMHLYAEAEILLKTLVNHCQSGWISLFAGEIAAAQSRYDEAEAYYKESINLNKNDERPYFGLAYVYRAIGQFDLSERYLAQAYIVAPKGYAAGTIENYLKIKKLLDKYGIRFVCVQYPMRRMGPLKLIFSMSQDQEVSFVDNEKLFKDALKKHRFEELFRDRFAGDFGHCTNLGNTLLARNIAKVILRDMFGFSISEYDDTKFKYIQ